MLKRIIDGELPSVIFRCLIEEDETIGNIRLGEMFSDEFANLDGEAEQLIWHWKGPGKTQGLSDASLDAELIRILREAGYI
jgi:hypothetical protein